MFVNHKVTQSRGQAEMANPAKLENLKTWIVTAYSHKGRPRLHIKKEEIYLYLDELWQHTIHTLVTQHNTMNRLHALNNRKTWKWRPDVHTT